MIGLLHYPPEKPDQPDDWRNKDHHNPEAGAFGLFLFLASLTMFFGASLLSFLIVRSRFETWPPPDMPPLPSAMWLSTIILAFSSYSMQRALNAIRRDRTRVFSRSMIVTAVLALAFLIVQAFNWYAILEANTAVKSTIYGFTFFVLTGLHALHVIGGIVPIWVVTRRANTGRYSAKDHDGVRLCAYYWHFLGVVWIILFVALFLIN